VHAAVDLVGTGLPDRAGNLRRHRQPVSAAAVPAVLVVISVFGSLIRSRTLRRPTDLPMVPTIITGWEFVLLFLRAD
jgi:hypothetical protein